MGGLGLIQLVGRRRGEYPLVRDTITPQVPRESGGGGGGAMDVDGHLPRTHGDVDDDGRERRTGTVWTAAAHIITAVIGSGVLSLAWAMAQLGWVAGPLTLVLFAIITFYTCGLLADCYRVGDPVTGKRNYTYTEAVQAYLGTCSPQARPFLLIKMQPEMMCMCSGGWHVWFCGFCQYVNMFGTGIGYTITASTSAAALKKSNCFHWHGHKADCSQYLSAYIIAFGVVQVIFCQVPNFHKLSWLSIVAAIMSFSYATIAVGLSLAQTISGPRGRTSLTGTEVGVDVDASQKVWMTFQALGNVAFAYSYSIILIEIQDTLRSPPGENKTMRKATLMGISTTTAFYMLCGCLGYSAFGNDANGNILTGFGFYEPYWLVDFANVCIVLHLVGGFQVFCQPLFAAMYIRQRQIPRFGTKWVALQSLSFVCFLVTVAACAASIQGVRDSLKTYTPFTTKS
ncbi:unnamed protein product [Triticum turgidum subsp. durum]|uniref:Amino acid transporter transmembrane domain-containing protein n=1 Tax=Triticum turgidum subsp. durum TaxID=4567 RepID=A0A9R0ZIE2_TRITD|nr:unnamed protein product [Triticum turgidum subsp. durum]